MGNYSYSEIQDMQRKAMEREAERAFAEEYANNLGRESGLFYN